MDERGIYAELPGYTDYDWVGGTIAAVSTGSSGVTLLTLTSVVSGTRSISLPADAEIYENNMLSSADALKVGSYARVNLDRKGTAESVRLGGAVTSYTGSVTGVEQDSLTVTVNGASKRLDIDRFTEVQVGKTGRRTTPCWIPRPDTPRPPAMWTPWAIWTRCSSPAAPAPRRAYW